MKLRPLADRVIVKRLENETTTASGIVLPDNAAEKPDQGEVLAVGPGRVEDGKTIAMTVKVGDTVLFGKYSGQTVKVDGEEVLVMKEDDLFAVAALSIQAQTPGAWADDANAVRACLLSTRWLVRFFVANASLIVARTS